MKTIIAFCLLTSPAFAQGVPALEKGTSAAYSAALRNSQYAPDGKLTTQQTLSSWDDCDAFRKAIVEIRATVLNHPGTDEQMADSLLSKPLDRMENARTAENRSAGAVTVCEYFAVLDQAGLVKVSDERRQKLLKLFLARLKEKDAADRYAALWILPRLATKDQIAQVQAALILEQDKTNQWMAAKLLVKLGDEKSAAGFFEHEAKNDPEQFIAGLMMIGGAEGKAALERLAKKMPKMQSKIDAALDKLEGHGD